MTRAPNTPPPWEPAIAFWQWPLMEPEREAIAEWYEERAAILEFCAGLDRGEAEAEAYRMTVEAWG